MTPPSLSASERLSAPERKATKRPSAEIEGELVLHPGVRDAAVVGVPHPTWGEVGIAFVVPGAESPSPEELIDFLAGRLAKYKIPREFRFVESLPRTAYGKVVKGELRQRYLEEGS